MGDSFIFGVDFASQWFLNDLWREDVELVKQAGRVSGCVTRAEKEYKLGEKITYEEVKT